MRILLLLLLLTLPVLAEPDVKGALTRWRPIVEEAWKRSGVPGCSVAVVYRGQLVMLEGYGVTNVDQPSPVTPDTVFQLASCSKPIATTAVAALVGEGQVKFDSRMADLAPRFALGEPWVTSHITVEDLCCHRSGLPGQAGNELEELGYDQAYILHALRYVPLGDRFRASYSYSNFGITAGVEAACGGRFPEVVQAKVFAPLGMTSSSARYEDFARVPDRAMGHVLEDGKAIQRYNREPDAQAPAAGVSSTARDLVPFMLLHLQGGKIDGQQIVARKALEQTHQPLMPTGFNPATFSTGFYGMGWAVAYNRYGLTEVKHSGAFSTGSRSQILLIPEAELGIAILANAFPSGLPEGLSQTFVDLAFGSHGSLEGALELNQAVSQGMAGMVGNPLDDSQRPARARPAGDASAYDGTYANDYFGPARVQGLTLSIGPDFRVSAPLKPWDGDTFYFEVPLDDGPLITLVKFDQDRRSFTLEGLNDWDTARFVRR